MALHLAELWLNVDSVEKAKEIVFDRKPFFIGLNE